MVKSLTKIANNVLIVWIEKQPKSSEKHKHAAITTKTFDSWYQVYVITEASKDEIEAFWEAKNRRLTLLRRLHLGNTKRS